MPRRDEEARRGLAAAVALYQHGRTRGVREHVHEVLTGEPTFRESWLRDVARAIRGR
ncbi:hypothetical protein [Nocardiopsis lucentensis]|uniref:hypothetical protein n=1 Tax=Nocardiopsis lucentensis TaxID=53441 RepID=UPI000347B6C2|nr:hypothetical protein [Nocardiopsis lucentensis]